MNIRFYHGWRWRRFDIGFGIEFWGGVDAWLMFGFYYCGVEIWRRAGSIIPTGERRQDDE